MKILNPKVAFLFFLVLSLYLLRLSLVVARQPDIPDNSYIKITSRITKQPYLRGSNQIITLGQVELTTSRFPAYFYGQRIEAVGKVTRRVISPFKKSLALYYPDILIIDYQKDLIDKISPAVVLMRFRGYLETLFGKVLSEPEASLLSGILLGSKKSIPEDFSQNLRNTGTMHVVVASGYNIAVVAGGLLALFVLFVSRRLAIVFSFLGIIAYTVMAGGEPPVVRAGIMASLALLAQWFGREKQAVWGLFLTGAVMLLISPLLLFDIGFQLSFLATAGILLLSPRLKQKFFELPVVGSDFKTTLSAQIMTLPIILSNFGSMSFLSPLVNLLILPTIPPVMVFGLITAGVGFISPTLAQIPAWFVWLLLKYFVSVVDWFGHLPTLVNLRLSFIGALTYYLVIGFLCLRSRFFTSSRA